MQKRQQKSLPVIVLGTQGGISVFISIITIR